MTTPALAADARNRALRTFLQGLGFTIVSALVIGLLAAVTSATSWAEFGAVLIGFSFFQSVAVSALSWLMRAYLDRSSLPTPTPPGDAGGTPLPLRDERGSFQLLPTRRYTTARGPSRDRRLPGKARIRARRGR